MARGWPKYGFVTQFVIACSGTAIGGVVGVAVAVPVRMRAASQAAHALRAEGQYVCGLFVLGPLFEGVVLGAVLGGLTGLVVSVLLEWLWNRRGTNAEPGTAADGSGPTGST